MNGYLFTAGCEQTQMLPTNLERGQEAARLNTWDSCFSAILYGGDAGTAQKRFESWCHSYPEGERPIETEIKKIVAAQFIDRLLTESGDEPIDWQKVSEQVYEAVQSAADGDDFEQGYWVEINRILPPGNISHDIESLKRDLPEDMRSGLNWSPDRQFFFLVSALSLTPPPQATVDESDEVLSDDVSDDDNMTEGKHGLDGFLEELPELRNKEATAMVHARNSVVAAWLWRKFAADTSLASNEIHIMPCCSFIPVEEQSTTEKNDRPD